MSGVLWFVIGLAVLPVGFGIWMALDGVVERFRYWYTRPIDLTGKPLAYRRSLIIGLTLELLDAHHVRGIRLPFNRVFVIRSNPGREYDFLADGGNNWVLIGDDFDNAKVLIGKALDELGYSESEVGLSAGQEPTR